MAPHTRSQTRRAAQAPPAQRRKRTRKATQATRPPATYYGRTASGKAAPRLPRNRRERAHKAERRCPHAQLVKSYYRCLNRYRAPRG